MIRPPYWRVMWACKMLGYKEFRGSFDHSGGLKTVFNAVLQRQLLKIPMPGPIQSISVVVIRDEKTLEKLKQQELKDAPLVPKVTVE